ncbi:hypothetical protein HAX54_011159 [Datura stramonium]|uniref:Uncharacterized protein n=1 Tax=Datura stramonium TaxID=4076 RepID=A0ABS8THE1_DATST|nr:hypothetical protein [Datura stramonium]
MREISMTNSAASGSPHSGHGDLTSLPFGSLGIMLLLIAVALIVLACSFRKRLSSSSNSSEKSACPPVNSTIVEMSPRIVVIMAGDHKPTHIRVYELLC